MQRVNISGGWDSKGLTLHVGGGVLVSAYTSGRCHAAVGSRKPYGADRCNVVLCYFF